MDVIEWYHRLFYFPIIDLVIATLLFFIIKAKRMTSEGPDIKWHIYYWLRLLLICTFLWFIPFSINLAFWIGLSVILIGYVIYCLSYMAMREHPEKKKVVVDWGIYKFSRHSHYIAGKIVLLGIIILGWNLNSSIYITLWIFYILDMISSHFAILSEEKINIDKFDREYVKYMNKVPRYF